MADRSSYGNSASLKSADVVPIILAEYHELKSEKRLNQQVSYTILAVVIGSSATLLGVVNEDSDFYAVLPATQAVLIFAYGVLQAWAWRVNLRLSVVEANLDLVTGWDRLATWERSWSARSSLSSRLRSPAGEVTIVVTSALYVTILLSWLLEFVIAWKTLDWDLREKIALSAFCGFNLVCAVFATFAIPYLMERRHDQERREYGVALPLERDSRVTAAPRG